MTIITQDKSKIINLPSNMEWRIWSLENSITKKHEIFISIGKISSQEKIAEFESKNDAVRYMKSFIVTEM